MYLLEKDVLKKNVFDNIRCHSIYVLINLTFYLHFHAAKLPY